MIHTPKGDVCPACGSRQMRRLFQSSDRLYATTTKRFDVVECCGCQLIRLHPWPPVQELHQYYPETYWFDTGNKASTGASAAGLELTYRRFVLHDHVRFIRKAMAGLKAPRLLDVGCGGGLLPRLLREAGVTALGLDYSSRAAAVAWHENGVPVMCGDLSNAPLRPESFSVITMFHVLEHLYDPASYLHAAHRLLVTGGKLIVQVPNAASWQFLLFGDRWNGLDVPRHLIDFRQRDLDALLENCGFKVLRHKHFSLRDNPAGMATSLAPGLDPMSRRIRKGNESGGRRTLLNLVYMGLVVAALPFTALEAACGAGSTVMIEAEKSA